MAKSKQSTGRAQEAAPPPSPAEATAASGSGFHVFRETLESVVVAFVLAFLFRTFEAEAFVIPTGSMSPSLLGQHKDVTCPGCGYEFTTTASSEGEDRDRLKADVLQLDAALRQYDGEIQAAAGRLGESSPAMLRLRSERAELERQRNFKANLVSDLEVVGGMCPMCRYLMPMRPDLPENVVEQVSADDIELQPSYPGDRILVNKYGLDFSEPERWDVVVFKFPGNGNMNYIKRLVGLPGEELQIYQGDVFARPLDGESAGFKILRKPPHKVVATLQKVHDTDYEAATLHKAGWPLRWAATTAIGWQIDAQAGEKTVRQQFRIHQPAADELAWIRYRHIVPDAAHWQIARAAERTGSLDAALQAEQATRQQWDESQYPQLISDFNAYNARLCRGYAEQDGWVIEPRFNAANSGSLGTEWTPDLAVECDVQVEEARGELVLDLVEAGYHFRATIDLRDGKVQLTIIDGRTGAPLEFKATGQTEIDSPGEYELRFANVDDQLLLWVGGEPIELSDSAYNPDKLFPGGRDGMLPWRGADGQDQGDLAPVGIGARGAKLVISRLAVLRDIYYIAAKIPGDSNHLTDYDPSPFTPEELLAQPETWDHFRTRRKRSFDIQPGQLFVMGDNSPESKDARLWVAPGPENDQPGGPYLDRKMLIGKAVCVFWPHSWGGIPGLPKLPGWPNFKDMRLVR